jgi:hypothetical protein
MNAIVIFQPDESVPTRRHFCWGGQRVFLGNEIGCKYPGVGFNGTSMNFGGPVKVKFHDQTRYPNQGYSCIGCPHLVIQDKYHSPKCAHPFYLELFPCPQYVACPKTFAAPSDCPMLGLRSETQQRRYRWHIKSHRIFWDYYHANGLNPYRQGFRVYNHFQS